MTELNISLGGFISHYTEQKKGLEKLKVIVGFI
jgi:hypothetical protein